MVAKGGGEGGSSKPHTLAVLYQFSSFSDGSMSIRDSETGEHGNKERR